MTSYLYPVPNGVIYGCSLKIENRSDTEVTGVYSDCGVFLSYNEDGAEFPLITASKDDVISIPANSTVWIHATEPTPWKPSQQCRLRIDSTSLPNTCLLTPVVKLGVAVVGDPSKQVV